LSSQLKARVALALLDKDHSEAEFLFGHMIEAGTAPDELLLILKEARPYLPRDKVALLWPDVLSTRSSADLRLRKAAVLVAVDASDQRWGRAAENIVADILSVNPLQLGSWTNAFSGVRESLIQPLVKKFREGDPNQRTAAARILNDFAADNIVLILDLLKEAESQQFSIFFEKARDNWDAAVKSMTEEIAFDLRKEADTRQFSSLFPKAREDPQGVEKSMREEGAKKPPLQSTYAQRDKLAGRQANALITLAMLGQSDPLWPALKHSPDPRVRSYLIVRMGPMGLDFGILTKRLLEEKEPSIRASLVLALGHYPFAQLGEFHRQVGARLLADYCGDGDPGVHSAIAWWHASQQRPDCEQLDQALAGKPPAPGQNWFVNSQGQIFVIVKQPGVFLMGSPKEEAVLGRVDNEQKHHRRIPRSFAICTREVTAREFVQFLNSLDSKQVSYLRENLRDYCYDPDRGAIVGVTWFEAAQYCRWLSEREKIPRDQWCYPAVADIKEGMTLDPKYLERTGYRLPTEAEWEFACRAGTQTPWVFGSDKSLLRQIGWFLSNSSVKETRQQAQTTCQKLPNALGLFDMHGNVYEWCGDRNPPYPEHDGPPVDDVGGNELFDRKVQDEDIRIYRGGSFADVAVNLRSAYRDAARPTNRLPALGFRLVRTLPTR
jgi:formylglycine-generating enzyme required for sulfatase activity